MTQDATTLEMRIPSLLSLIGTLTVMITIAAFPKLRKLRYAEIVMYISINDFLASTGTILGPKTTSAGCWYQGLVTNYNYLTAIFWTNVIAYQLYAIVVKNDEAVKSLGRFHAVCWFVPLIVTLLPLSTNTYGEADDNSGWCFIADRPSSPTYGVLLWIILSFYLWVWLSILFILGVFIRTGYHLYQLNPVPPPVKNVYIKLGMYPLALILCWLPTSLDDTFAAVKGEYAGFRGAAILNTMANILPCLQGFLLSLIFFGSNGAIRNLWLKYCCRATGDTTLSRDGNELVGNLNRISTMTAGTGKYSEATDFGINASLISWDMGTNSSFDGPAGANRIDGSESSAGQRC